MFSVFPLPPHLLPIILFVIMMMMMMIIVVVIIIIINNNNNDININKHNFPLRVTLRPSFFLTPALRRDGLQAA